MTVNSLLNGLLAAPCKPPFCSAQQQRTFLEAKAGPTMPRASPQPGKPVLTAPCLQAPRCGKTLHHITQLSAGSLHGSHTGLLLVCEHLSPLCLVPSFLRFLFRLSGIYPAATLYQKDTPGLHHIKQHSFLLASHFPTTLFSFISFIIPGTPYIYLLSIGPTKAHERDCVCSLQYPRTAHLAFTTSTCIC